MHAGRRLRWLRILALFDDTLRSTAAIVEQSRLATHHREVLETCGLLSSLVAHLRCHNGPGVGRLTASRRGRISRLQAPACMMVGRPESALENEHAPEKNVAGGAERSPASFILSSTLISRLTAGPCVLTTSAIQISAIGANCGLVHTSLSALKTTERPFWAAYRQTVRIELRTYLTVARFLQAPRSLLRLCRDQSAKSI